MADKNTEKKLIQNPNRIKTKLNDSSRTETFIFQFWIFYFHPLTFNFRLLISNFWLSVDFWLLIFNFCLFTFKFRLLTFNFGFSTAEFWILTLTSNLVGLLNLQIIYKGTLNLYNNPQRKDWTVGPVKWLWYPILSDSRAPSH